MARMFMLVDSYASNIKRLKILISIQLVACYRAAARNFRPAKLSFEFLVKSRAAGHLSHRVEYVGPGRSAGRQRVQRESGGKMRRTALEPNFKEFAVIAPAERHHSASDFSLAF